MSHTILPDVNAALQGENQGKLKKMGDAGRRKTRHISVGLTRTFGG